MGEDDGAVVDSQLRVRGIDGLRVVDASIMPAMPSPNIHPATIMVAEKSSDIIGKALANRSPNSEAINWSAPPAP
jgi:choline dehydrogenase